MLVLWVLTVSVVYMCLLQELLWVARQGLKEPLPRDWKPWCAHEEPIGGTQVLLPRTLEMPVMLFLATFLIAW